MALEKRGPIATYSSSRSMSSSTIMDMDDCMYKQCKSQTVVKQNMTGRLHVETMQESDFCEANASSQMQTVKPLLEGMATSRIAVLKNCIKC